ncbi:hypothetical protein TNCV_639001 [Trichonephila clavipes]|nr:hypothetical protein TNCV_639001 [Trichonephila clavipes]
MYQKGDLVAIQRTQFGSGLKLRPKFLGPYKVIEVKPRDRYNLERVVLKSLTGFPLSSSNVSVQPIECLRPKRERDLSANGIHFTRTTKVKFFPTSRTAETTPVTTPPYHIL